MTARLAVQYIELDISWCSLSYGVGACPAVLGVDSADKCFNTKATCPVSASYADSTVTLRFTEETIGRDLTIEAIPDLQGVSFTPAQIAPGESLGKRAQLKFVLRDHPDTDTGNGFDKYVAERAYNPYSQGTIWGKFRARQPYLRNRVVRWYQGYSDQSLSEMECRTFQVDSFDGPSADGVFTVNCFDPLRMLDGDQAQAPAVSNGKLIADITNVATSATLTPVGIGNSEYPASGFVCIGGDEICSFTRAGDVLTLTRGQLGTTASAHSAADRVQVVLRYSAADAADIIYDLMSVYAGVPTIYLPLTEWQTETSGYLNRNYTGVIAEPTSVAKLVSELMRQAGLSIWWDDLDAEIRLRVLRGVSPDAQTFDDSVVLPGSFSRKEQPNKRISQVWVFYGQKDPTQGQEDTDNYRSVAITADLENDANYGSAAITKVFSRWISQGGLSAATRVGDLLISRYGTPPRAFSLQLLRDAQTTPELGNAYYAKWRTEQDEFGVPETVPVQVMRISPSKDRLTLDLEEVRFAGTADTTRQITVDYDALNLNWRTLHDDLYPVPVGGETVTLVVEAGVTVGSTSAATPSLDTGTWPTRAQTATRTSGSAILTGLSVNTSGLAAGMRVYGTGIQAGSKIVSVDSASQITLDKTATSSGSGTVTVQTVILNLEVRGTVQAAGGAGGTGADGNGDVPGTNGSAGGTALLVRAEIEMTDADGALWGGGGGGGGGPCRNPPDHKGGGGGGGAGTVGGAGGVGPGNGRDGAAGTASAGGAGGHGWTNNNFFAGPEDDGTRRGGDGGGPGLAGQNGQGSSDIGKGNGGAAGNAIDGLTKINTVGSAGDRRGGQIN